MSQIHSYIKAELFPNAALWDLHERIGYLLGNGLTQFAVSYEAAQLEFTLSYPVKAPPPVIELGHDDDTGGAA